MIVFSFRITMFKFNPTENDGLCCFPNFLYQIIFAIFNNSITSNWTDADDIDRWHLRKFGSQYFGGVGVGGVYVRGVFVCVCVGILLDIWICNLLTP